MNNFLDSTMRWGAVIWRHTAALVALLLVIAALIVGYLIGSPSQEASPTNAEPVVAADVAPREYYCSMHPQIRSFDPDAKCQICHMDLVPVPDDFGEALAANQIRFSDAAIRLSEIATTKVARHFPTAEVRLYGKLTYDETSVARITAYFPGRLDRLFVNYIGVPVARGDHLAEMYSPQLLAAFEEIRQARNAVDDSTTSSDMLRRATEQTLKAAREKLRLFGLTDSQIAAAETGDALGERLTVYSPIAGIVTHLAAREGDYVETGSPIATVADLKRLWLDMEAYESQLPLLRWGQPVAFTVEAHPGDRFEGRISFIEPLVDERTRTAAVRVAVDNTDRRLKPGMFASATVRMRVASGGAVVSDELAGRWVGPMHPTIVKDGPGQCDICGMDLVPAESLGVVGDPTKIETPLVIPRTAALLTGRRAIVYVRLPGATTPTFEAREVMLGSRAGESYIVEHGLEEGEDVVVKGAFRIDSAMQIIAKPSMMMPGGSAHQNDVGHADGHAAAALATIPESFLTGLSGVYGAYLQAQEALANDHVSGYVEAVADLKTANDSIQLTGLVGEPLAQWRRASAHLRIETPGADLDQARIQFQQLSDAVIALQRRFGHRGEEHWSLVHCPMAFDMQGAEWLQRRAAIHNPYFGASMLDCGEIRETFPPSSPTPGSMPEQGRGDG